ncbi:MAG TPA: diguanylate cyclase, partial [Ideonella sp.]|nr:diguanylate cyclase [Ideonella sp.]
MGAYTDPRNEGHARGYVDNENHRRQNRIFTVVSLASNRLGARLLGAVVITSICVGLVAAAIQLKRDYDEGMAAIEAELALIKRGTTQSLANSLWTFNQPQIALLLNGLLQMGDVERVELRAASGEQFSAGQLAAEQQLTRSYELRGPAPERALLGELLVQVSLDGLRARLTQRAYLLLLTESAKALCASLVLLYIFNVWITRPLRQMAQHVNGLRLDRLGGSLRLNRPDDTMGDELGQVATAINRMSAALADELGRRDAAEAERARLFAAYERNRWLLQAVIDNTPALVLVRDLKSRYLLVNRRYRDTFAEGQDLIGQALGDVFSPKDAAALAVADKRAVQSGAFTESEIEIMQADGPHTYLSLRFPLRNDDGELFAVGCVASDITERKHAEERIRHLAQHDALTGLPNRELLRDRIKQAIAQAHRNHAAVAVMFLDLDHFKNVNDSLGHEVGDQLLRAVAERL